MDGSGGKIYLQDTDASLNQLHDIASNSNNFQVGTRTSSGVFVDTFYQAIGSASGTSIQQWNILGINKITLNSSGLGIGTTSPQATLDVVGDVLIKKVGISNQENLTVSTGTEVIASLPLSKYTAAFFDFVVKSDDNIRSGTVFACHDGTNVEFTETSTADLGNTSAIELSVDISGTDLVLSSSVSSGNWSVKTLVRAL